MNKKLERMTERMMQYLTELEYGRTPEALPPRPAPRQPQPEYWELSFSHARLIRLIGMLSHYRAKSELTEKGNRLDDYAVTEDEQDIIGELLASALKTMWLKVARMSRNTDNAFEYDDAAGTVKLRLEVSENYDRNILELLSGSIEEFVVWKVLMEWWKIMGYDRGLQLASVNVAESEERLTDCIHWRKKPVSDHRRSAGL